MSLVLDLEHSCPWPRECLFSEGLFLALALSSDFFVSLPWPRALCPPRLHLWPFILCYLAEVESRTQGSGPRPRTQKKIRGQGQGQPFRGQTLSRPRTAMLEAKDQEHKPKCSPPQKKRVFKKILQAIAKKKKKNERSSKIFFKRSTRKNVFQIIFQALHKILTIQKIVLSSSREQANFRGLEASRPRPRTSKCVL